MKVSRYNLQTPRCSNKDAHFLGTASAMALQQYSDLLEGSLTLQSTCVYFQVER